VALHHGRVLADDTPVAIQADQRVVDTVIGRSRG
jgi:ABC-type branched-subunit amino acid transport system ATPase component